MKKIFTKAFVAKLWRSQVIYYLVVNGFFIISLALNQLLYPTCDVWITEKILAAVTPFVPGQILLLVAIFVIQLEKVYDLSKYKWYSKLDEWNTTFIEKYPIFTKWLDRFFVGSMVIIFIIGLLMLIFQNPC